MCGRYLFLTSEDRLEAIRIIQEIEKRYGDNAFKPGEVFPGSNVPVLAVENENTLIKLTRWGFDSFNSNSLIINARSETITQKPTFKKSFEASRCLVPATGFYEWNSKKEKFLFTPEDNKLLYMAGLIKRYDDAECMVIITTTPNSSVKDIHNRMPLIISEASREDWLYDTSASGLLLKSAPEKLISRAV